ncbi:hypothetical protein ACHAXA_009913 [Cyclostephanos tholiformis]|uniref:DUF306 domain-containing protein n=1 Tax=Cyclostephanos tholiformis TaxID=382380 RepID=A0ABD3RXZ2_9STRA
MGLSRNYSSSTPTTATTCSSFTTMWATTGKLLFVVIAASCAVDSVATRSHFGGAGAMLIVDKSNDNEVGDERRHDSSNSSPNRAVIGTSSWSAKEVELDVNITAPITLEFDLEYGVMRGNTGCNRYSGSFINLTDDSFSTSGEFATTRMYCDGLMEQESAYLSFLKGKTFFYTIVENIDDTEVDELVLYDRLPSSDCKGEANLARFVSDAPKAPPLIVAPPSTASLQGIQRRRAEGDFSALNGLLSEVTLRLPDATVSESGLDLTISQLTCAHLRVGDVSLSHVDSPDDDTSVEMRLGITGLAVDCTLRWDYRWTIFSGGGTGYMSVDPSSSASVSVTFVSADYDVSPPHDAVVSDCDAPITISNMNFDGDGLGMIAGIMNLFEGLLRGTVEGRVRDAVCEELRKLAGEGDNGSGGALDYLLTDLRERIEKYLEPLDSNLTSPVWVEMNEIIPTSSNADGEIGPAYVNFREAFAREWIDSALVGLRSYLGQDPSKPDVELGINTLLREYVLDEGGSFDVNASLFSDFAGFQGQDMLTETNLTTLSIKIEGLDSFRELDVLRVFGNHTLRNTMKLDGLSVIVEMMATMRASSKSDAIIVSSTPEGSSPIEEIFTIHFNMTDIEVDLSMFIGINAERWGDLKLGPMLHTKNILPCLLSAIDAMEVAGLTVTVGDITPPTLHGFIDGGIDRLVSAGAVALFDMYEGSMLHAMPSFFQTYVRGAMNDFLARRLSEVDQCPETNDVPEDRYIDFREMFQNSSSLVGRYGDIIPWVMKLIKSNLFVSSDGDATGAGLLAINDVIIKPITMSRYGTEGIIRFNGTLVDLIKDNVSQDIWRAFADNLRLTLSDLTITGLDTFHGPVEFLEPRSSSAYLLGNRFSLGGVANKPLNASLKISIEVGGALTSPLATNNVVDLQISMPSMEVFSEVFATVRETRFTNFPLKDVFKLSCWLSTIPLSDESHVGIDVGLSAHYLNILFDVIASTRCVSCSNPWLEDLSSIIDFLDENEFVSGLKSRALSIGQTLLQGDWVSGMVDRRIVQAQALCPHDAAFGKAIPEKIYPTFRGTRDLVDGILYAAFPIVQVMAVIIAEKHSNLEILSPADVKLDVPVDVELIDLTNLTSIAGWADIALVEARGFLGGPADNSRDLGISSVFRSSILDSDGLLRIPIRKGDGGYEGFEAGGVTLSLYDVTLVGLDSFTFFDILNITGPSTFSNSIKLKTLGVTVAMGLSAEESSNEARMLLESGLKPNELESISVSLILKDVTIDLSLLMALDHDEMGQLKIGSIINTKNIFSCLLSTLHSVGLSDFAMNVGDISDFSIAGFISDDTSKSIQSLTSAFFFEFKQTVLDAIPAFTSITVRPILHDVLQVLVDRAKNGACPEPDNTLDGIVDFRDLLLSEERAVNLLGRGDSQYGNLFRLLYSFVENMTSKADGNGLVKLNDLVASLTERQSNTRGNLHFPGQLFKQDFDVAMNGLVAAIELEVSNFKVSNLDSIGVPLKVLQPVKGESSVLNNTVSIGAGSDLLRTEFRLLIKGKGNDVVVYNDLVLGLNLKSLGVMLEFLAQIKEMNMFVNFPLQDIMNINCWLATVVTPMLDKYGIRDGNLDSGIVLRNLAFSLAEASIDINCIECSSPLIVEMESMLGSQEAVADTTDVANMILDYISQLLGGDFIQYQLDKKLTEAAFKCPHFPTFNEEFSSIKFDVMVATTEGEDIKGFLIATVCVILISGVIVASIFVVARRLSNRRHDRWVSFLNIAQKVELEQMQSEENEKKKDLNNRMTSLFRSSEVPLFIRVFIPVIILGNIALFLSGHLSLGGTVNISGSFAGQSFNVDGFFEFSMAKSTVEMWNAGAKELAILITIFSGVWPYVKQLTSLFVWFAPPRRMSFERRGSLLLWLDILGKWSIIDVFVLLMTLASFRLSIESPENLSFLPSSLYSINMLVVPLWGLYANLIAQLVSQVSSHVIIHYHRKCCMVAVQAQEVERNMERTTSSSSSPPLPPPNNPENLPSHQFTLDYEASSKRAIVKKSVNWILSSFFFSFVILVICGCALPSFGIEVFGLVGLAVESGRQFEQAKDFYSVFGLATMIMEQARYLNTAKDLIGLGTLASLLVITVFLVPLAQAVTLFSEWFRPMTKEQRLRNTVLNEILAAWQYMEVYVLSIVISAWQLGGVSEFMINAYCGKLQGTFTSLSYYGILSADDAQCFRVEATLEEAAWILVTACVILCMLKHFICGASLQKTLDDDIPPERRLHSDRWLQSKVTHSMSLSGGTDDEENSDWIDLREPCVLPVRPRFTDYYFFATKHRSKDPDQHLSALILNANTGRSNHLGAGNKSNSSPEGGSSIANESFETSLGGASDLYRFPSVKGSVNGTVDEHYDDGGSFIDDNSDRPIFFLGDINELEYGKDGDNLTVYS